MKKILTIILLLSYFLLPEISYAQVEFVSDTTIRPSKPNRYRIAVINGGLRIVPQTGNTIPIIGGSSSSVNSINGQTGSVSLVTTNIPEGSNLYYTNSRVQTVGDARYPLLSGSYSNPSWLINLPYSKLTGTPTTVSGYGITDAVKTVNTITPVSGDLTISTSAIPEGSNQYYTNTRARASISSGSSAITYVNSTGVITLTASKTDVGLGNVDNTTDASKPVSTAQQTAFNLKADKSTTIPFTTVSSYAAALALSTSGLTIIMVNTDEQYTEINSMYFKLSGVLYKFVRSVE